MKKARFRGVPPPEAFTAKMGKKRKVETRAAVVKAGEQLEKMSPPVGNKRKKESGSVTPRHQYPDSDCESGTIRFRWNSKLSKAPLDKFFWIIELIKS